MIPRFAICPDHGMKSTDFVSLNSASLPIFRCAAIRRHEHAGLCPSAMPHYFTVTEGELATRAAKKKVK